MLSAHRQIHICRVETQFFGEEMWPWVPATVILRVNCDQISFNFYLWIHSWLSRKCKFPIKVHKFIIIVYSSVGHWWFRQKANFAWTQHFAAIFTVSSLCLIIILKYGKSFCCHCDNFCLSAMQRKVLLWEKFLKKKGLPRRLWQMTNNIWVICQAEVVFNCGTIFTLLGNKWLWSDFLIFCWE